MKKDQAIGIFDSGIGGLTVAHAIKSLLPQEQLIYFGDTAHLPYGEKSPEAVRHFSERISQFLLDNNCKCVVIACNTASALAYPSVQEKFGAQANIYNVIDPVADSLAHIQSKGIGVIGTRATISSNIYAKKIKALVPKLSVKSLATPLLAHLIEEGYFNNTISEAVIHDYLKDEQLQGIDHLILACTHYPLIAPQIQRYYQGKVKVLDSAGLVAQHIASDLKQKNLLRDAPAQQVDHFYISDYTDSFNASARMFFQEAIHLEAKPIWL